MRTRITGLLGLLAFANLLVLASPTPPPPARAVLSLAPVDYHYLPEPTAKLRDGGDIVVDEAHGQVFVAQSAGLRVTDLAGVPQTTIAMPGGQYDLSMSQDGSTVYAAVADASGTSGHLVAIDAGSHAVSTISSVEVDGCWMFQVTPQAGLLWFVTSCETESDDQFGYVDPADGSIVTLAWPLDSGPGYAPQLEAVPGTSNRLLMLADGKLSMLEISTADIVATHEIAAVGVSSRFAVGPSSVVARHGEVLQRYSTDDLAPVGSPIHRQGEISDIVMRSDGTIAIASHDGTLVAAIAPDGSSPFNEYRFREDARPYPAFNLIEWGTDRLYDVSGGRALYAFEPRAKTEASLSRGEDKTFKYGESIPLTFSLTGPSTPQKIVLWHVDGKNVHRKVLERTVTSGETIHLATPARRTGRYELTYAGDDTYDPAFAKSLVVRVRAGVETTMRSGRLVGGVRVHRLDQPVEVRTKVLPNHARDAVRLNVGVLVGHRWRHALSRWLTLSSNSTAGLDIRGAQEVVGYTFRVQVTIYRDVENNQSSSKWIYFKFVR